MLEKTHIVRYQEKIQHNPLVILPEQKKSDQALKNMNSASVVNKIHFATKIHFNYQVAKQKKNRR